MSFAKLQLLVEFSVILPQQFKTFKPKKHIFSLNILILPTLEVRRPRGSHYSPTPPFPPLRSNTPDVGTKYFHESVK
jgi:hypothetical protein